MREQARPSAVTLFEYLYDQLDALATIDLSDAEKVDAACKVNRAVNDTAKSILGMVDMSLRAYDTRPGTVSSDMVRGFFEETGR